MNKIFREKKNFCIRYKMKTKEFLFLIKAISDEEAKQKFLKKVDLEMEGVYPFQEVEILSVERIYKKVQF